MKINLICLLLLYCCLPAYGITINNFPQSRTRTVMVQLFEWPWRDIARECEMYLGPNNFLAVHVSPPTEHLVWENSPWWERYQPISYNLNSRSGSEADFRDMVQRCLNVGVEIYVDVVFNHMAGIEEGIGHAGTRFTHYEYPGLYSYHHFHHCGRNGNDDIVNFFDPYELLNCELVNLADLATELPFVRNRLAQYVNKLVEFGVRGLRIDAAKHMPARDIRAILDLVPPNIYVFQELVIGIGEPVMYSDYLSNGDVTVFGYSFDLGRAFKYRDLSKIAEIGHSDGYPLSQDAVVFVDDHDLQRNSRLQNDILTYGMDGDLYRLANYFLLAWPYGYPRVFSGFGFTNYDQGPPVDSNRKTNSVFYPDTNICRPPWYCEHRLPGVGAMVEFHNVTDAAFFVSKFWHNSRDLLSFSRGRHGFIAFNLSRNRVQKVFASDMPPGYYCNVLSSNYSVQRHECSADVVWVAQDGAISLTIEPMSAVAIHSGASLR